MLKEAIEILATTPEKLRREIGQISLRQMKTRPAEGKWSVQEILAHLEDAEEHGFRARIGAMIKTDRPFLAPFDQEKRAVELHYNRTDPYRSLNSLSRQRRANVRWLRTLRPSQLKRKGVHHQVGEMSVEEYVFEWAFHDLGHLKQILETRRYALYPRMGNMKAYYHLV
jgi:uncharacterized damage-inducible protein DinB